MTDCPPRLRGDLSKWLCEINTGVYVGQVSSRVREALWTRVCENLANGRATMVYSAAGEQRMMFRVHNTPWTPLDYDGITLMRRPLPAAAADSETLKPGFSNAAKRQMTQRRQAANARAAASYTVIDLETTGLSPESDVIVEFGALKVTPGRPPQSFARLVRIEKPLPRAAAQLTGISDTLLSAQGVSLRQALTEFLAFVGRERLVGYNIAFDLSFLRAACQQLQLPVLSNRCVDLLSLARRKVYDTPDFKLTTLAEHFSLPVHTAHRALADCQLVDQLYRKLNGSDDV